VPSAAVKAECSWERAYPQRCSRAGVYNDGVAIYSQTYRWSRWTGTPQDLARVVSLTLDDLERWGFEEVSFTLRAKLKNSRELVIDDPGELAELVTYNRPADIEEITVTIGRKFEGAVELVVRATPLPLSPAVALTVRGDDQSRVQGLGVRLKEHLDHGKRWLRGPVRVLTPVVLGLYVGVLAVAITNVIRHGDPSTPLTLAMLAVWAALMVIAYSTPVLELVQPGQPTRLRRWGGGAVVGVGILGTALSVYQVAGT
jgi:hypothetical protein